MELKGNVLKNGLTAFYAEAGKEVKVETYEKFEDLLAQAGY